MAATTKRPSKGDELFNEITEGIIDAIEQGLAGDWQSPWATIAGVGTPVNTDGRPYRGLNVLWLAIQSGKQGYNSGVWGTYKAWSAKGCQVRKGEKATAVLLWKPATFKEKNEAGEQTGEKKAFLLLRTFNVFAAEQVDGAEAIVEKRTNVTKDTPERIAAAEAYFAAIDANVVHGGDVACYSPGLDVINLPVFEAFKTPVHYYATRGHETVHWTGHKDRLDRLNALGRFATDAYAVEELVAELGAAFIGAQLGLTPINREDHLSYLASWLRVLKATPRALVTAASKAQQAVDHLNELAGFTVTVDLSESAEDAQLLEVAA